MWVVEFMAMHNIDPLFRDELSYLNHGAASLLRKPRINNIYIAFMNLILLKAIGINRN